MKRLTAIVAVTAALFALSVTPVDAQNGFDLSEVPRLGYNIDPTEGNVGDDVHSNVNTDDINEHCWDNNIAAMPPEELLAAFETGQITLEQLLSTIAFEVMSYISPGEFYWFGLPPLADVGGYTVEEAQEAWEAIYGPPPADFQDNPIAQFVQDSRTATPPPGIPDDTDGQNFVSRVGDFLGIAFSSLGVAQLVPQLYPNLFITTFVDPATQEMVGDMGNFDPGTGQGTMAVPDLASGLYAVAAACVFFPTPEQFMATWGDGLVNAWNYGVECVEEGGEHCFPPAGGSAAADWAAEGGLAALLSPILAPRAIGIDFYCILQDDGTCATPPGPPPELTALINGNGNGETPPGDGTGPPPAAEAVVSGPSFTG